MPWHVACIILHHWDNSKPLQHKSHGLRHMFYFIRVVQLLTTHQAKITTVDGLLLKVLLSNRARAAPQEFQIVFQDPLERQELCVGLPVCSVALRKHKISSMSNIWDPAQTMTYRFRLWHFFCFFAGACSCWRALSPSTFFHSRPAGLCFHLRTSRSWKIEFRCNLTGPGRGRRIIGEAPDVPNKCDLSGAHTS